MRTYHVALCHRGTTAIFQFRKDIDTLSCEAIEYCGHRETTRVDAVDRLRDTKPVVLEALRNKYPKYDFQNVVIE